MKATSWPLVLSKHGKPSDSPPSDQDSQGFIVAPSEQISNESVSSKSTIPLDIVREQECHSIVENESEKEFSELEAKYYADLAEHYINEERNDGMNESDTFGTL
ncbi:hypothetical protein RHMOL_Rhmol02G0035600 [Rhododendron molle]|uniref:Uncharacterized protein n=1 Tax=Rhododendron molle TaxID=49168 RepID=A0ACC0PKY0_RHOML|nr:hypothetical protein RHMOL_Rhmol02G0035600 [Rhododendron molle]